MSACRSACHSNNFRKSRVSDVSAMILARMSVSASWNADLSDAAVEQSLEELVNITTHHNRYACQL